MKKKLLITIVSLLSALCWNNEVFSQQNGPNCPSGVCIGPGGSFSNASLTVTSDTYYKDITVESGKTLTVKPGATLYVGKVGASADEQAVDFKNGCTVIVESGAFLVVNGKLNNWNNSQGVTINGLVVVIGDVSAGHKSTIEGSGAINATGAINTENSGSIFGSQGDCETGPCIAESGTICNAPTVDSISAPAALCPGSSLNPTAPKVTATGSAVTAQGWQLETAVGSNTFSDITVPYTVAFSDNGKKIRYYATNACSTTNSNQVAIAINEITNLTGDTNTTQCLGTNYSYTVLATNADSYQWKKSVTSGNWTNVENGGAYSGAKTAKLSITGGTPSESADYRVDVTFASGCVISSPEKRLTFLAQSPAPTVTVTQPTCSSNGTITVTGGSAFSFDEGQNFETFETNLNANVKSELGIFKVVVKNEHGCVSLPVTVSLEMSTATWNGSAWSKAPTNTDAIVFDGNYSSTGNLSGCSCLVKSGNVVINSAHTLTLQNAIVVTNGTFTLENNASLIQVNGVSNSGSITVKRDSAPMVMYDYTYWSSPTSGTQTLKNFAPKSNPKFLLTYDNKWMYESSSSVFKKGIGYSILAPEIANAGPTVFSHQFVGVPNNGNITVPVTHSSSLSSKLVGNPYPSAINADKFIAENASTITGTLYFWTHNNAKTASGYSNDYAAYNATGGIATAVASGHGNTKAPKKWIASGQGFVVSVKSSGNVVFNNSMRIVTSKKVGDDEDINSNFYRSSSIVNSEKVLEKHRIWLNLVNDDNVFSQTLLGYVESATNGDDFGLDGVNFGEGPIQLYSLIDKSPYVIQARALPFSNDDEVPLGYKTLKSGNFKIAIDNMDGIFDNVDEVIIEDKLLGISQNIKAKPYNFSSESGVFNNRFVLKYGSTTLGLNDLEAVSNEVTIFSNNHRIQIQSESEPINKVFVYDMLGRQVFENTKVNSTTLSINNLDEQQVLVVKAILDNGQIVTKKIIN
ncbi:MAG: T9SS sorting signal type C domain-containing protein [Flavobacterium sp.]